MRSCEPTVVRWRSMASMARRDGGGEADAVLGVADVVVHRLRHGDDFDALAVEFGGIAESVVAADGDQVVEAEGLDVLEHAGVMSKTVDGDALLGGLACGNSALRGSAGASSSSTGLVRELCRIRAAGAVDRAGILAIQRQDVARAARRVLQVDVRQAFPAAADADHLAADLAAAIDHRFDDGIQTRDVAAARENADTLRCHGMKAPCAVLRILNSRCKKVTHADIPTIFITGYGDIPMAVKAMTAGAVEFLTKPVRAGALLDAVGIALERDRIKRERDSKLNDLRARYQSLSARERKVLELLRAGLLNKQIAGELKVSEVTAKVHRHHLGAKSLPDLVRMAGVLGVAPRGIEH